MHRFFATVLLATSVAAASGPTTRPVDVRPAPLVGQAIDGRQPAFVPDFAVVRHPLDRHFAERAWAFRYGYPGPIFFGEGYGGCYGGYDFGSGYGYGGFGPVGGVTGFGTAGGAGGFSR